MAAAKGIGNASLEATKAMMNIRVKRLRNITKSWKVPTCRESLR
jgi:hypothetical protein